MSIDIEDKGTTLATFTGTSAPAYKLSEVSCDGNVSCSGSDEFCFFCHFSEHRGEDGECSALWDVVRDMVEGKKELPLIVKTVHRIYREHIQPTLSIMMGDNEIQQPNWTPGSIRRHLVFSSEFPELFDGVIDQIFYSIIMRQNNSLVDEESGEVIEPRRSALMDTLGKLTQWRNSRTRTAAGKQVKARKKAKLALGSPD